MFEIGTVLVIGDIILDKYQHGDVERISPEAPCPIFSEKGVVRYQLGGASNVANQLKQLDHKVALCGKIADDECGAIAADLLQKSGIDQHLTFNTGAVTTLKTRYISGKHQQVFRIDKEQQAGLNDEEFGKLQSYLSANHGTLNCIVLCDYDKGVLSNKVCQWVISFANEHNIPTVVDVKIADADRYTGATVVKGNVSEISKLANTKIDIEDISDTTSELKALKKRLKCNTLVMTCGAEGIVAIDKEDEILLEKTSVKQVYDVTGAGDVVTSYIASTYIEGVDTQRSLSIANRAAAISVSRFGTSVVRSQEVMNQGKQISIDELERVRCGRSVVFTNGCFDIIHAGHIDLLKKAKSQGDMLIVGLNSDASVRRLKGNNRPVNNIESRVKVLSAISDVDYIMVFDEDTPEKLIHNIMPDVLVKGADYNIEDIVGADFVQSYGGKVMTIPFVHNISSTEILNKL